MQNNLHFALTWNSNKYSRKDSSDLWQYFNLSRESNCCNFFQKTLFSKIVHKSWKGLSSIKFNSSHVNSNSFCLYFLLSPYMESMLIPMTMVCCILVMEIQWMLCQNWMEVKHVNWIEVKQTRFHDFDISWHRL